jgi:hypothetical protein
VGPLRAGIALLALAQAPVGAPVRPAPPPGLSWEEADRLAATVERVERRLAAGRSASRRPIVVTESELNSYVTLSLAARIPAGVQGLAIEIEQDRLAARATLDLDRLKGQLPQGGAPGLLGLLSGTVPVEIRGRVPNEGGKGRIVVEQASVAGVSLPSSVVAEVVAMATRSEARPAGFDLQAPFDLPWTARRVRLESGRATFEFAP